MSSTPTTNKYSYPNLAARREDRIYRRQQGAYHFIPRDYQVPEWEPDPDGDPVTQLEPDEFILGDGRRRSGKTTLFQYIMLKYRHLIPSPFVMTRTPENGAWQQIVPANRIFDGFDEDVFNAILQTNSARLQEWARQKASEGHTTGNPFADLVLEDVVAEMNKTRHSKAMYDAGFNGRHRGVRIWTLAQDHTGIQRSVRGQADRIFLFASDDEGTFNYVKSNWGQRIVDMWHDVTKEPHTAFMIINKVDTPWEKKFWKVKADIKWLEAARHRNLHLGNVDWWAGIDIKQQKLDYPLRPSVKNSTLTVRRNDAVNETTDELPTTEMEEQKAAEAAEAAGEEAPSDGDPQWFSFVGWLKQTKK